MCANSHSLGKFNISKGAVEGHRKIEPIDGCVISELG